MGGVLAGQPFSLSANQRTGFFRNGSLASKSYYFYILPSLKNLSMFKLRAILVFRYI